MKSRGSENSDKSRGRPNIKGAQVSESSFNSFDKEIQRYMRWREAVEGRSLMTATSQTHLTFLMRNVHCDSRTQNI